ncbi:MAG: glycosyltransferase family protein [Thermoanaerobaculia bacterium]
MKRIVVLQARMGSTRLPGKVLADIGGKSMLAHVIERAARIPSIDQVVVATSIDSANEPLMDVARQLGVMSYAGSEADVLDRYYQAARLAAADVIVRVTADCPLLDPSVSGAVIERFCAGPFDYVSNTNPPTFPDGLDTEVFSFQALERAWRDAALTSEREHVTPFLWKNTDLFRIDNVTGARDLSHHRWTVDDAGDLAFVRAVFASMAGREDFGMAEVLEVLDRHPELRELNSGKLRNEGYAKSLSEDAVVPEKRQ